jgi:hypothetical protein
VEAMRSSQDASQLPLGHADRVRFLAAAVQDTRDESLPAEPSGRGGAVLRSLIDLQTNPFVSHGAPVYPEPCGRPVLGSDRQERADGRMGRLVALNDSRPDRSSTFHGSTRLVEPLS